MGDLGAGEFDGAWLISNFENLNPTNAIWSKYYDLYANIDTEEERFLDFENWWNGFYRFSTEEIVGTVSQLFIGNEIESGELEIHPDCHINLKKIKNPIFIFASEGDEITPPYEALAWVAAVYKTDKDLKAAGQRIVYMIHPTIGHLGIFVSAEIARHEHNAILGNIDQVNSLKPGLYEMKILDTQKTKNVYEPINNVKFEPRSIEELASHYSQKSFERVRQVSELNDSFYSQWLSPWVKMTSNPVTASAMRWLHPMRTSRYMWAQSLNPFMRNIALMAPFVRENRLQSASVNPSHRIEEDVSNLIVQSLDKVKKMTDDNSRQIFRLFYNRPHK